MPHPSLPQNPLHLPGAQRPPSPTKGITGIRISSSTMEKLGDPTRSGAFPRSPEGDRKRRRSPSPFEHRSPRPRFRSASHSPERSRSPSPSAIPASSFYNRTAHPIHSRSGQGQVPTPPGVVEHAVSFKSFTEWLRGAWPKLVYRDEDDRGSSAMGKRYEAYRKVYYHRQLVSLFLAHRESAWFIERYSGVKTHVATRKRLNREGRVPRARAFLEALSKGDYDNVSYDQEPIVNGEASRYKSPEVADEDGDERSKEREEEETNGNGAGNGYSNGAELDDRITAEAHANQLFVKTIPPSASRKDLEKMFRGVDGLVYLAISEPSAKKSYHRVAWAQYAEGTDMEAAVKATDGQQIDSFTYHVVENVTPAIGKQRLTAPVANTLSRLERDLHLARELAKKLEAELLFDATIDGKELEGLDGSVWEKVEERIMAVWMREGLEAEDILDDVGRARRTRLALDQYLHYLRKGLNTCYYCVAPLSHIESLNRQCISHVRPREGTVAPEPEVEGRKTQDQRWVESLESKMCLLVDTGDEGDLQAFTKRHYEEEIRRLCAPLIRQESANKYACTECNKMFKAPEYVIKHLPTKHRELMADVLEQIAYFHSFVLDPNKISPQPGTLASISLAIPKPSYATGHTHHPAPTAARPIAQPMSGAWNPAMFPGIIPSRPPAPAPLPPAGNEDPRAKRGRVSYMDLDEDVAGGEGGLPY